MVRLKHEKLPPTKKKPLKVLIPEASSDPVGTNLEAGIRGFEDVVVIFASGTLWS
jgi:hypothetical protein